MDRDATWEEVAALSQVANEFTGILQAQFGVPDCDNCAVASTCSWVRLFGLDGLRNGNPGMEACSNYEPLSGGVGDGTPS